MTALSDLLSREPVPELPPATERARLRRKFGLTQQQLADALEVSVRSLRRWENGTLEPIGRNLIEYAKVLHAWQTTETE
jgi:DNA-binding transcriptional regulator YiaG